MTFSIEFNAVSPKKAKEVVFKEDAPEEVKMILYKALDAISSNSAVFVKASGIISEHIPEKKEHHWYTTVKKEVKFYFKVKFYS